MKISSDVLKDTLGEICPTRAYFVILEIWIYTTQISSFETEVYMTSIADYRNLDLHDPDFEDL